MWGVVAVTGRCALLVRRQALLIAARADTSALLRSSLKRWRCFMPRLLPLPTVMTLIEGILRLLLVLVDKLL